MEKDIYDLIIVGGGPAGMTAGIYAGRLNLKTLLITKNFGGQIAKKAVSIDNYPGFESIPGQELVSKMENQLKSQDIDIELAEVKEISKKKNCFSILTRDKKTFEAKAIILASGADPRPLEVKGEKEFLGKGVSYCALCDGPIFKNKDVAVAGGGNAGFETAIFLTKIVRKIYILEAGPGIKAFKENIKTATSTGKIEIMTNIILKEIKGNKFVESLVYEDKKSGQEKILAVSGIFVEVGYQPATSYVKDLVDFNEKDEIIVEFETCQTKTQGLYAAGDLNVGQFKQIITACGEGAKAALAAYRYIENKIIDK